MSHFINPSITSGVGIPISKDCFWFKDYDLTEHIHTKGEGDKRAFKDASVYVIHDIVKEYNYYLLVNNKHELLYDTTDFNGMLIYIEQLKSSD